jgi:hypothetical protein
MTDFNSYIAPDNSNSVKEASKSPHKMEYETMESYIEEPLPDNIEKYIVKTDFENIPFQSETKEFTVQSIADQKHALMKHALQWGLKLKAMD